MTDLQNHYDILQVSRQAEAEIIRAAYRKLVRRYHPDRYLGERALLERQGKLDALHQLDKKIIRAQIMTQKINAAYAILSDPLQRSKYDRWLAMEGTRQANQAVANYRAQHPEYTRRTVKARPHHRPGQIPRTRDEAVPYAVMGVLLVALLGIFAFITNIIAPNLGGQYVPQHATAVGVITAPELQATSNARQATVIARTAIANRPQPTARNPEDHIASADALYNFKRYRLAIASYDLAIEDNPHNAEWLYKRGLAHAGLFNEGNDEQAQYAIDDFSRALALDDPWIEAYRERGMLYFARWQQSRAPADAVAAQSDLEQYLKRGGEATHLLNAVLETLRTFEANQ